MTFLVLDRQTKELLGNLPTPWLIEAGHGKAWRNPGYPRMWSAVDYPGAVPPEGAEIRDVRIVHRDESPDDFSLFGHCQCIRDENDEPLDHPLLMARCSNPDCSDYPPAPRECSISDCVCVAATTGRCVHCDAPVALIYCGPVR